MIYIYISFLWYFLKLKLGSKKESGAWNRTETVYDNIINKFIYHPKFVC